MYHAILYQIKKLKQNQTFYFFENSILESLTWYKIA